MMLTSSRKIGALSEDWAKAGQLRLKRLVLGEMNQYLMSQEQADNAQVEEVSV